MYKRMNGTIALLAGILFTGSVTVAQEDKENVKAAPSPKDEWNLGVRGSLLLPSDSNLDEIYGTLPYFGIELIRWYAIEPERTQWGYRASYSFTDQDGEPIIIGSGFSDTSSNITIFRVQATGLIRFRKESETTYSYIGFGIGFYSLEEELDVGGFKVSGSDDPVGFHFLSGIVFDNKQGQDSSGSSSVFFLEATFSSVSIDGVGSSNIGGLELGGGVRFKF